MLTGGDQTIAGKMVR